MASLQRRLGRRLLEAGVRFVNVTWDCYWERLKLSYECWDTHERNTGVLKDYNLPQLDLTYSALMEDLDQRGLLDETLVVVMQLLHTVTAPSMTSLFFMQRTNSLAVDQLLEPIGGQIAKIILALTSNSLVYTFKLRGWVILAPLFVSSEAIALASI